MSRKLKNFLILIVLISIVFVSLFPILFLYGNSFMESSELQKHYHPLFEMNTSQTVRAIYLIPEFFSSEQYKILFFKQPTYVYGVINSMILVLPSLIGCFLIAPSAGYSLAIFDIPGKKIIIFFYILFSLLPSQTMLVPNYFVLSKIHLIRSRWAIWLPAIFTPLPVYLIYRFFQKTPNEMLESARIEGCSELRIFFQIALPQISAGLSSLLLLEIIDLWNLVEQPLLFLKETKLMPLTALIYYSQNFSLENFSISLVCS